MNKWTVESRKVVIVGGGPNGLLTACELAQAGVDTLVLERLAEPATAPKANGLVGRVVQALDYRGLYERISGGDRPPVPVPYFSFGALTLDLSDLDGHALYAQPIPQRRLEELLAERAGELGVEVRRGHEMTALNQDGDAVTLDVRGPGGDYRIVAAYAVGADGGQSPVRKAVGIGFPGFTDDGFVSRSGQIVIHAPVATGEHGDLDIPGPVGRIRQGSFTRTETGCFGYAMVAPASIGSASTNGAVTRSSTATRSPSPTCATRSTGCSAPTFR